MDYVTLSNGDPMPMVGFRVFQITDAKQCEKAVLDALDAGYRLSIPLRPMETRRPSGTP